MQSKIRHQKSLYLSGWNITLILNNGFETEARQHYKLYKTLTKEAHFLFELKLYLHAKSKVNCKWNIKFGGLCAWSLNILLNDCCVVVSVVRRQTLKSLFYYSIPVPKYEAMRLLIKGKRSQWKAIELFLSKGTTSSHFVNVNLTRFSVSNFTLAQGFQN